MSLEQLARETAAICRHSKHPASGAASALDLICKHGKGDGYHSLVYFMPGVCAGLLSCNGCSHFEREH